MFLGINQSVKQIKGLLSLATCQCLLGFVLMTPNVLQEFCEDETFEADCGDDSVIMVQEARYGRMRLGSCLTTNYGSVGCSTDMVQVLDKDCSGRHNCRVNTRDLMVAGKKPCPKDLRNYLEASYRCIQVQTKDVNGDCCRRSKEAVLTAKSGHIASIITQESDCGSIDCPWVVQAEPGQKIHLYLYDFDTYDSELGPNVNNVNVEYSHTCHVYVIIKEDRNSMTACAEGLRERHIYTTDSNRVEIRVVTKKGTVDEAQFMINYTVSGCADPPKPKGGWIERHEDYVLVGCTSEENKATWKLTCKDKQWIGDTPNCTSGDDSMTVAGFLDGILSLTPDMSIILICLIALSISIIILSIGIFCIRRKWHHTTAAKHSHYDLPGNIDGQVISNQSRDQHFIARLEHKNSAAGAMAEYGHNPYGIQQKSSTGPSRAHTSTSNDQQDIIVLPEGYRDVNVYGKRPSQQLQQQHYVEHIYESPTFARKEYSRDPSESSTSAKYYELEADTEPLAHMSYETKGTGICQFPARFGKPVLPSRVVTSPLMTDTNTHINSHSSY